MDNNNGALSFDVLIKDSNIDAMLSKDEKRIMEFSEKVEGESNNIAGSFEGIGKAVAGIAVTGMLTSWVSNIVSVRGAVQQLEIAFSTMLGSEERAATLMQQITETAATTPFDLQGVSMAAKQLIAYGESAESVNETLVRLGNIASGLGIPLGELTYLYGTTMVQGRLFAQDVRQFMGRGIPLVQELAKELGKTTEQINTMVTEGKIGFPEVQRVIESLTNQGGMFYGLMEKQSKSLTGQLSNLGDAYDGMLNDIGSSTEGILAGGISAATYLVENYEECVQVLGSLVAAYGTYKAAVISVAVAQRRSTGIAALDNIVLKARAGLFVANTANGQQLVRTTAQMTASQQAYTLELQKALTVEQQQQLLRNIRVAAITQMLTAEQQLYVSRLNLNTQSVQYLAVLESVLTAEQRAALSKKNLTANGMAYSMAVQQSVNAHKTEIAAQMAATKAEGAAIKQKQLATLEAYRASKVKIEQTRVQIALAQQEGATNQVAALQQRQYTQLQQHATIVKEMQSLATQKQIITERAATLAKQQGTIASRSAAAADTLQATTKSVLTLATTKLVASMKALWATMMANPITALITLLGTAVTAIMLFGRKTEEEKTIQGEFQQAVGESSKTLQTYFAIIKNSEPTSKTYKDTLAKINSLCQEHNIELLKENASLEQQASKQEQLNRAIEAGAAARIKAKYTEQALNQVHEDGIKTLEELAEAARNATHQEIQQTPTVTPEGTTIMVAKVVDTASNSIQNASAALWEGIISQATEASSRLGKLSGDEYQKAFEQLSDSIKASVKDATQATDAEMKAFAPIIDSTITKVIDGVKRGQNEIDLVNKQIDALYGSWGDNFDPTATNEKVASVSMTFEELEKMAAEAEKKLDELNGKEIKVEADYTDIEDLADKLQEIEAIIGAKENNLNTESGINNRIKQLKELRAEAVIGSKTWEDYNKRIAKLQLKLPKTTKTSKGGSGTDWQQKINDKVLELQVDVEEKRIATIKNGFTRRQQELELEHKKELKRIEREQAELEKAYKAVKKPMPQAVKQNFEDVRTYENASYEAKKSKLVDEEIDYKKKQYKLYYSWLQQYGAEVANSQFAELLDGGSTYAEWLQGKINILQDKLQGGLKLSLDEGNTLVTMQNELNAINGVQSATEAWNESLERVRDNSHTAGEYLAQLATKKQELATGKTNLIGEDRAQAMAKIDSEILKESSKYQAQLLDMYKGNAKMREDVERQYQEEITWLEQNGYKEQAENAEQARVRAIGELQAMQIQGGSIWQSFFRNAQYLSGSAFEQIKEQLRALVEKIQDADIKAALLGQLEDLEQQTAGSRNPFKQLAMSIKEYNNAADGTVDKKAKLQNMMNSICVAADQVKQSFDSIVGGLKEMGLAGDEETQAMLGNISDMMGGATELAKGISTKDPAAIISGGVNLITSAVKLFDSSSRRIRREMKRHEKQLQLLQRMYAQIQYEVENSVGEDYYRQQQKAIENLEKTKREYEELARLEQSKKKKDRNDNKVQEYLKAAEDAERQIKDIEREITETLVQTNFRDLAEDLASVWAEAFGNMEDSAESFDKVWNQTIANAVKNSLKLKLIEPIVKQFTDALADYMGTNNNSLLGFDFAKWKTLLKNAGNAYMNGLKGFEEFFTDMGEETDKAADTLEGQVAGVTEDTASKVAGEMTTMRIRQYDMLLIGQNIEATCIRNNSAITSCIMQLQTIARNTQYNRKLVEIEHILQDIKNNAGNSNPLHVKGINY